MITAPPDHARYRAMQRRIIKRHFADLFPAYAGVQRLVYPKGPVCVPVDSAFIPDRNIFDLYADEA